MRPGVIAFSAAAALDRPRPDAITFNAAIGACGAAHHWEASLALLQDSSHARVELSVLVFNAAISACERGSTWAWSLKLLDAMQVAGIHRDLVSRNTAILACTDSRQWQRAFS